MAPADVDSAIAFPLVPFRAGKLDPEAHRRNVRYLVRTVEPDTGRRVIATGGGSLLHHLTGEEQVAVAQVTGEEAAGAAWFISGVLPTPPADAARLIRDQMQLQRPPDAFLLLPLVGGYNPEGVYRDLGRLCRDTKARFILYLRDSELLDAYCRLARECDSVLGVKIGTSVEDVAPARSALGDQKAVVWGIGDISTQAARRGARGHTSGSALLSVRLSDRIHNAQRRGNFAAAEACEAELREFEEIRFMRHRAYNYSAVVEALRIAAFDDVDPGDGGPFNAPPPLEIRERLPAIVARLRPYH